MILSGLITGTLGYSLKREFLANAIALRDVESYAYEIASVDLTGFSAKTIQSQIYNQFTGVYSGDINVTVFNTENTFSFPSDSLRATKYNVTIEVRKPIRNLASIQPELASGYYAGLDAAFWTGYSPYLTDFKETFTFVTNANGNREFSHDISFGLRTGWGIGGATSSGRKSYAQTIASGIFANDKNTTFGLTTMVGSVSGIADTGNTRNYFSEGYDLIRNTYNFSRRRELLPFDGAVSIFNLNNTLNMNTDGTVDVSEKAYLQGKVDFSQAKASLESYLASSFARCSGVYSQFYVSGVMMQDSQYSGMAWNSLLPLINIPTKTIKTYDARSLNAGYDVTYTNNPTITGNSAIISQTIEFDIDPYDKLDASHTFDFTVNRAINNSGYIVELMNAVTGASPNYMQSYYTTYYPEIYTKYNDFNLIKTSSSWSNIKTKSSTRISYSNNPSFFVSYDGMTFRILDYSIDDKKPVDVVNEFEVINRPTKTSVLSYGYQTERGEIVVNMRISLGKQSLIFYPNGVGNFGTFEGYPISRWLQAIYKYGGELLMQQLNYPTVALNWFISDSKFTMDSEGNMTVQINYTYTLKKKNAVIYP
jgi:hypothetical protein